MRRLTSLAVLVAALCHGQETPPPTAVFLLHGLGGDGHSMEALAATLGEALDPAGFVMEPGFDYSDCGGRFLRGCPSYCSLSDAARRLASFIIERTRPGQPVILLGFSFGALAARDMIVQNPQGIRSQRRIVSLVSLAGPHLGYPYTALDALGAFAVDACPTILREMSGDLRGEIEISPWLQSLIENWSALTPEQWSGSWLAVSGGYCQSPWRTLDFSRSIGCPDANPASDGVVCAVSAEYSGPPNGPTRIYHASEYAHSRGTIMCGFSSGDRPALSDPRPGDELTATLVGWLNQQAGTIPAPPPAGLPLARLAWQGDEQAIRSLCGHDDALLSKWLRRLQQHRAARLQQ